MVSSIVNEEKSKKKRNTWRDSPKIINNLPIDKDKMIMYVDESGEGNKKVLKRSFEAKKNNEPYQQRNDLYILNGVVLSGYDSIVLKGRMDKLKRSISPNGEYMYPRKGIRPIVLRNSEIGSKTAPYNNMTEKNYEGINKLINTTNYVQIAAGLNYYCYTQFKTGSPDDDSSPLLMCLGLLLVNYADYLNTTNKKGIIVFEEETKSHDTLKLKYILKVLKYGNKTYNKEFFSNITAVYFRKKWTEESTGNYVTTSGLELADLTISPLRRMLHPEYLIIERKLYNYPNYIKKGFTIIT